MNGFLTPIIRHTSWKKRAVNCPTLSESKSAGGPYTRTQCRTNSQAITAAVILFRGTVRTSFEKRSVITSRNRLPFNVVMSSSSRLMLMNSNVAFAGNRCKCLLFFLRVTLFLAHVTQFLPFRMRLRPSMARRNLVLKTYTTFFHLDVRRVSRGAECATRGYAASLGSRSVEMIQPYG